jgi:hypothetical protein
MKFTSRILKIAGIVWLCWTLNGFAAEPKWAQTGFQFLSVPTDARVAALGEAFTAMNGRSMSIFYNPANTALTASYIDFNLSYNQWIADINHYAGTLTIRPANGRYGTFGVSILSVDYGELQGTIVNPNSDNGYSDTDKFKPSAFSVGVSYAQQLSEQFAFGAHIKYAAQDLTNALIPNPDNTGEPITKNYSEGVLAFDFGTIYRTGFKSLVFGMSVRNFSQEVRYESEGFQLPLVFNIGIAMDVLDVFMEAGSPHSLVIATDVNHPRAAPEQVKIGVEYMFMDIFALRGGYHSNVHERDFSVGTGIAFDYDNNRGRIALDYSYTPFGVFDKVQRFTFNFSY